MQCLFCGKDLGQELGMCAECRNARDSRNLQTQTELLQLRNNSSLTRQHIVLIGLAVFFAVVVAAGTIWATMRPLAYAFGWHGDTITVGLENSGTKAKYAVGGAGHYSGRIFDSVSLDRQTAEHTGGARSIATLTEEDYATLQRDYLAKGKCPAAFLNTHHRPYFLIGKSAAASARLRSMDLRRGMHFQLSGNSLKFQGIVQNGTVMPIPFNPAGKIILVEDFTVR